MTQTSSRYLLLEKWEDRCSFLTKVHFCTPSHLWSLWNGAWLCVKACAAVVDAPCFYISDILRVNKCFCQITPHFPSLPRPFIPLDFLSLFYHHRLCSLSFPSRPRRPRSLSSNSDVCNLSTSPAFFNAQCCETLGSEAFYFSEKLGTEEQPGTKLGQTLINSRPSGKLSGPPHITPDWRTEFETIYQTQILKSVPNKQTVLTSVSLDQSRERTGLDLHLCLLYITCWRMGSTTHEHTHAKQQNGSVQLWHTRSPPTRVYSDSYPASVSTFSLCVHPHTHTYKLANAIRSGGPHHTPRFCRPDFYSHNSYKTYLWCDH